MHTTLLYLHQSLTSSYMAESNHVVPKTECATLYSCFRLVSQHIHVHVYTCISLSELPSLEQNTVFPRLHSSTHIDTSTCVLETYNVHVHVAIYSEKNITVRFEANHVCCDIYCTRLTFLISRGDPAGGVAF